MKIPDIFIPDKDWNIKIQELKQKTIQPNKLSMLEDEIHKLENELEECKEKMIKNHDYYAILTDPYKEEREITLKLINLRIEYLEKKGDN